MESNDTATDDTPALKDKTAVVPEVVDEELTSEELADRHRLELKVEKAFYEAGLALRELRDRRLYRSTNKSFEEYCRERFGFTRRHVDYLVLGSQVVENLLKRTNGSQNLATNNLRTIGSQILPTSERQVRPLTALE